MNFIKSLFSGNDYDMNAEDAKARIDGAEKLFVLDVRQPNEFKSGHISGANLIPLKELGSRLKEVPKDTEILCVCRSGSRSNAATKQLLAEGYTVMNLRGGMMGWERANYPVKRGK
jgi:rhodanese-related sulfurtransferase